MLQKFTFQVLLLYTAREHLRQEAPYLPRRKEDKGGSRKEDKGGSRKEEKGGSRKEEKGVLLQTGLTHSLYKCRGNS